MNDRIQIGYLLAGLLALLVVSTLTPFTGLTARAGPPDPASSGSNPDPGLDIPHAADSPYRLFLPVIAKGGDGGPGTGEPVMPYVFDGDLRDLPTVEPWEPGDPVQAVPMGLSTGHDGPVSSQTEAGLTLDPVLGLQASVSQGMDALNFSTPDLNFEGITFTGLIPPDPVGDIGPNHYIQMVNSQFQIFDRLGNPLLLDGFGDPSPRAINQLWIAEDTNDACENNNNGDPIVVYDNLADRWVMSQFAIPNGFNVPPTFQCVAVSQGPNPVTSGWFLYTFEFGFSHDYPKLTVWSDAYYMSSQRGFSTGRLNAVAFDRTRMLVGDPATFVSRSADSPALTFLPSDLDGPAPPAGTPNFFVRHVDSDEWGGANDRVEVWQFTVNFVNPAASTFALAATLPTAPFDSNLCFAGSLFDNCAAQPDAVSLATIPHWPMWRAQYRNFGTHETIVFNHTVDADGAGHAGIRWYELRRTGGVWSIFQQGTHSPDDGSPGLADDPHRWMGSIAMDNEGNIALGYSVSSDVISPSIRYAGRLASDPLGTLPQGEFTIIDGVFTQDLLPTFNGSDLGSRWGDYSSMNVDPLDDCTFWYTNEYVASNTNLFALDGTPLGNGAWGTRVASFWFCNHPPEADANGPYETDEGVSIALDGTGSSDPDGDALTYEWAFDNDGVFDDAIGPTPLYDRVGQDGVFPVFLRVTDPDGAFSIDQTSVTVNNVAPTLILDSDTPQDEGSPVTVNGIVTDPGWLDPLSATIDWDDGSPLEVIGGDLENDSPDATFAFEVAHVYGDNGDFNAEVCASDDDTMVCETIVLQIDNVDPTADIDLSDTLLVNGVATFLAHAGEPMQFSGRSTDPGSDDLDLSWDWDDGPPSPDVTTTYLVNPPDPDPFPSPSVQPRDVTDVQSHAFGDACLYHIDFLADDDDGGHDQDSANVLVTGNADRTRSAGYWQHQYRGNGNIDFDQATLECYLAIVGYVSTVFNEERDASTIDLAYDVLFMQQNEGEAREHFDRELLTVWLNFANGAYEYDHMLDTDQDGVFDTPFAEVVAAAEAVRLDPTASEAEIREQKDILHHIPQMSR